jgi:hypothetical protein
MAIKTFTTGEVLTAADTNTYLANSGLVFVKSQTIGSAVSTVTVSSAFSTDYDNYVILISGGVASGDSNIRIQLGATATGYYYGGMFAKYDGTSSSFAAVANNTFWDIGYASTNALSGKAEIDSPFLAKRTIARTTATGSSTTYYMNNYAGFLNDSTSYTAFTITISAGTMTGGTIAVYGFRKG